MLKVRLAACAAALVALAGSSRASDVLVVTVTPSSATMTAGTKMTFQASAIDTLGNRITTGFVTWTATGGSISSLGAYTAGSTPGVFRVTATIGGVSGSASVSIKAATTSPAVASIAISPGSASTGPGGTISFQAQARDASGNALGGVVFSWSATGGTITSSGVYTAGSTAGTFTVHATCDSVVGSATVTVTTVATPTLASIVVTPASASTTPGGSLAFQAQGRDANGNALSGVVFTWSATGGTITGGSYVAGSMTGSFTVTASSGSVRGTATVTIQAPASSSDPSWYATPAVVGSKRVISLAAGAPLQAAFNSLVPGDVLELGAGTHPAPNYPGIERSGTATNWIVVRGAPGTRPIIDLQGSGELHVGGSYVLLENVEVKNGKGNNLHVMPPSASTPQKNVILRNVYSHAMASGTGAVVKVSGNWTYGSGAPLDGFYVEGCELTGSRDNAIVDGVGVRHAVVRDSYLHDPIFISMRSPGIFFKGGSSDVLIERNLIRGIRGNGAVMVGGDTGAKWFDGLHYATKLEGVNQVIRNNVLADFDDSAFEIRGARNAKILNNTIVTQTSFAIFRITWGGAGSGTQIGNDDIAMSNNLVLGTGTPAYAVNTGNADATLTFGPSLWGGSFKQGSGGGIPSFPRPGDVVVGSGSFGGVVANPSMAGLTKLSDALQRYVLAPASPAKDAGSASSSVPRDILDKARTSPPSIGAFE